MEELKAITEKHPALRPMVSGPGADPDIRWLMEGAAFRFAMLRFEQFFGGYSSINSFAKLIVKETQKGEYLNGLRKWANIN